MLMRLMNISDQVFSYCNLDFYKYILCDFELDLM